MRKIAGGIRQRTEVATRHTRTRARHNPQNTKHTTQLNTPAFEPSTRLNRLHSSLESFVVEVVFEIFVVAGVVVVGCGAVGSIVFRFRADILRAVVCVCMCVCVRASVRACECACVCMQGCFYGCIVC